ncbi:MAG: class I SAM-dependent rRNA methyltransferase [bacterium]
MLKVILDKKEEENVLNGFPWIFNNEVSGFEGPIKDGSICSVYTFDKKFVCYGFFNSNSKIMVRVLTLDENEEVNYNFFKERIQLAIDHRNALGFSATRLVFSEADFLPGLVVDKYGDYLSVQFMSLGMDIIKDDIVKILVELCNPKGIYERSDVPVRKKEGLEETKGFLYKEFDTKVIIEENGIKMQVDIENGQKTGYFLDQKLNRDYLKYYVKGKTVLDCFSHTGGFALHAAKYDALSVDALDISQKACDDIMFNASLNPFKDKINAVCVDVFDYLRSTDKRYDVVVLDPPAFVKTKDKLKNAIKGYKEINLQALKLINKGGYLFTYSCSQHMTTDIFFEMVQNAVKDSKRKVQFLDLKIQSPDHPALLNSNEQLYLKCIVLRVL